MQIRVKRRPRGDAANEPREPREQPLRIDVRRVHPDLPPPIGTEPARPRRVYIRNSVELARYGYTPGFIGCEAAFRVTTRNSAGHEPSKPCLQMPTSVHESRKRMKECHVQYLMRNRA